MFLHPTKLVTSCLLKRQPSLEADIASAFCIIWWVIIHIEMLSWILNWNDGRPWDLCPPWKQAPWRPGASPRLWDQELVQERTIALVLLRVGEKALVFFSQWHNGCWAQYNKRQHQERCEGGSPGTAGSCGCVHKVLEAAWYLTLVGGLVKINGYAPQEEANEKA